MLIRICTHFKIIFCWCILHAFCLCMFYSILISVHLLFFQITMITFLLLVLSIPIPLLSEDITLRKGNEVICLSNIDSPIYLDPPFVGKHNSSANFLHLAGWDKDNWTIKNESEIIGPVIDKRWEGKVFLVPI
jgi:hypothetical protein